MGQGVLKVVGWLVRGLVAGDGFVPMEQTPITIFATPDFGASAGIGCFLLLVGAIILILVLLGVARGVRLLNSGSPQGRRYGILLLLVSGLVPLFCCLGPAQVVRLTYGNYPLGSYPNNKVKEGMTADEVVTILGTPHERHEPGEDETWYYWIDSFSIHWFGVSFGPDGRVVSTFGN